MLSNYRKSAGRFGEKDDEYGVSRPTSRPDNQVPNADFFVPSENELLHGLEEGSDPIWTQSFCGLTEFDDDVSSLGNETARPEGQWHNIAAGLPIDQPMSDEEWKAIVFAAQAAITSGSINSKEAKPLPPCFGGGNTTTYRLDAIEEDPEPVVSPTTKSDSVGLDPLEKLPEKSQSKDGMKKSKKKKSSKGKRKSRESVSSRTARTSGGHGRTKSSGEASVSNSDPSSLSGMELKEGKRRTKKKSRKSRSSSTPGTRKKDGASRRRKSRSSMRKCDNSPVTRKTERRARSATRGQKHKVLENDRSVDPQEIDDFIEARTVPLDGNCKDMQLADIRVNSVDHANSGNDTPGFDGLMSDSFDDYSAFEEEKVALRRPPSFQMSLHPEVKAPRDCKPSVNPDKSRKSGNRSLELAIASKPKLRANKSSTLGSKTGRILQRIWCNGNHRRDDDN